MVVEEQNRRRPVVQRSTKKVRRIDGRLSSCAEAEFVTANQPVPAVNTQKAEDLTTLDLQPAKQVLPHNRRVAENLRFTEPCARDPMSELKAGQDGGGFGGADAADSEELGRIPPGELRKAAGGYQDGVGLDHRTPTTPTGPHQHRQKLSIRKDGWTELEQSFPRPR